MDDLSETEPSTTQERNQIAMERVYYVGLDTHKESIAIAIAQEAGEVRAYGQIGAWLNGCSFVHGGQNHHDEVGLAEDMICPMRNHGRRETASAQNVKPGVQREQDEGRQKANPR